MPVVGHAARRGGVRCDELHGVAEQPGAVGMNQARPSTPSLRVLIVAEHASAKFGGEAVLPLHYFRLLLGRGIPVWLFTHARVRDELLATYPEAAGRIFFIEDQPLHMLMWRIGQRLPARLSYFTTGFISRLSTQITQRRMARRLVREHGITVVHQPMPVSPKEPSLMHGLGAPVVIGPMNGGMVYPPGFERGGLRMVAGLESLGRATARWMNFLMPGKRRAALLLVANKRTLRALPGGLSAPVVELPENGVDLRLWQQQGSVAVRHTLGNVTRFIFMGRLVDWKAVDLLLRAFSSAQGLEAMALTVVGDGPQGPALRDLARQLGLLAVQPGQAGKVYFAGWKTQVECAHLLSDHDALVLPSLWECGGAVVLEAMACGLPVLATDWGGPADYLDASCGVLVPPKSPEQFIAGLTDGLQRLAASPALRHQLGQAGRRRVEAEFDWEKKMERMLQIYAQAVRNGR